MADKKDPIQTPLTDEQRRKVLMGMAARPAMMMPGMALAQAHLDALAAVDRSQVACVRIAPASTRCSRWFHAPYPSEARGNTTRSDIAPDSRSPTSSDARGPIHAIDEVKRKNVSMARAGGSSTETPGELSAITAMSNGPPHG